MDLGERHYNSKKLTILFAIASLVLLGSLGRMLLADYDRPWKKYQEQFKVLEMEKARVKFDEENNILFKNDEYKQLSEELAKGQKDFVFACPAYETAQKELSELKTNNDIIQQKYKFSKAELDAAKYRHEFQRAYHDEDNSKGKSNYAGLKQKTEHLKIEEEQSVSRIVSREEIIKQCEKKNKELERKARQLSNKKDLLERKLKKIDPNEMSFSNRIANLVRDLPIIDLANPTLKVEQIVLKNIRDDVNFVTVPKVDRCITCHLGIANPDYQNADQPFRTHPNLELYIGKNSPHPLEDFGCTVCHGGRGRSTDFVRSAHTPSSHEQKKEWVEKYNWQEFELWEDPMLPLQHTEAGCFKCHGGQTQIKGAQRLNLGLQLIETAGCYSCHQIDRYNGWPKPAPSLENIASKVSKDWTAQWIKDPHLFRHHTWMPNFFGQSNNSDPYSVARTEQEILAIVHYLFENSKEYENSAIPLKGDVNRGEELVSSVGCMACHQFQNNVDSQKLTPNSLHQQFGPNLTGMGSKTSKEWIYSWIKDPKSYHTQTRMPDMSLTDQEAADIAEYLYNNHNSSFESSKRLQLDETALDNIVFDLLASTDSQDTSKEKLSKMTKDEKLLFAGKKMIAHYGCYSCHSIPGFENVKPIGTELTYEGSKDIHKLDFGFSHIEHTKWAWFEQKLKEPRIFDHGKIKGHLEKLRMPNYNFSQEEVDAVVTALLGFVETQTVEGIMKEKSPEDVFIDNGQRMVRQFNCQGCHLIENSGGAIGTNIKDWLVKHDGRSESEADAMLASFSPPNLIGEGEKVQAKWLFEFLHKPVIIRPWLKVRMPNYEFNAHHLNALVKYFNALDKEEFPFLDSINTSMTQEQYQAAEKLFSEEYFGCAKCHIVGDQMPSGSADSWAPNFALAKTRLKPGWIIKWLKNPQDILPGTKMPTYFDPQDFDNSGPEDLFNGNENDQIRYLRDFLMSISEKPLEMEKTETNNDSTPAISAEMPQANLTEEAQ